MNWITLNHPDQLGQLLEQHRQNSTQFTIFKHSTRCSTSRLALKMFESQWKNLMPAYLVHVVENRQVSNDIEKLFGVRHESPQVLLIVGGKCIYHASHSMIDASEIEKLIESE